MKKIVMFISVSLLLLSCKGNGDKNKYTIIDVNGRDYGANFYNTTDDGCIMFNDVGCGCGNSEGPGTPTRICGSYTVVENIINK